jgi:hypothetical protein
VRIRCVYQHEHEKGEQAQRATSQSFLAGAANVSSVTAICCVFTDLQGRGGTGVSNVSASCVCMRVSDTLTPFPGNDTPKVYFRFKG